MNEGREIRDDGENTFQLLTRPFHSTRTPIFLSRRHQKWTQFVFSQRTDHPGDVLLDLLVARRDLDSIKPAISKTFLSFPPPPFL